MIEPLVYIVIDDSAICHDENGEIVETVEWSVDGHPWWKDATICDHRGGGGAEGYALLDIALRAAEANAVAVGYNPQPLSWEKI